MNRYMAEIYVWTVFEPESHGRKANTITIELKGILFNAIVRY